MPAHQPHSRVHRAFNHTPALSARRPYRQPKVEEPPRESFWVGDARPEGWTARCAERFRLEPATGFGLAKWTGDT